MKAFQQPALPQDPERLHNRRKVVKTALSYWQARKPGETTKYHGERTREHINENIQYFQTQLNNIDKLLKVCS